MSAMDWNDDTLALIGPGGQLKIWDGTAGRLTHEYSPSAHLASMGTCLAYAPSRPKLLSHKKPAHKKRKIAVDPAIDQLNLIAMGTTSGLIVLYSLKKAEHHTHLKGGHSTKVNAICWSLAGDRLYSCDDDSNIVEWSVPKASVIRKWKGGNKGGLFSICLCHTQRHLLTAGRQIKLWDLDKLVVENTFTGHATEVVKLVEVPSSRTAELNNTDTVAGSVDGSYFASMAVGDRHVNIWQVNSSTDDKNAIASLALPDEAVQINLGSLNGEDQLLQLAVITLSGKLVVFEHVLNGKKKRPLVPKYTVQVATSSGKNDTACPLPIIAASFYGDGDILIMYGNVLWPVFEKLVTKDLEPETCLVRDDNRKGVVSLQAEISTVKTPKISKDVSILSPGTVAPNVPTRTEDGGSSKEKRRRKSTEMTMEEKIQTLDSKVDGRTLMPRTDCFSTILSQGLQSRDKKILNSVLQRVEDGVINSTVTRLQLPDIVPLLKELSKRLVGHAQSALTARKWLKCLTTVHASYLMTLPNRMELLGPMHQMMASRFDTFVQISQIQGKLGLSLMQTNSRDRADGEAWSKQPSLLAYQDESSDEDMLTDGGGAHAEFSEEDWEEKNGESDDDDADDSSDDGDASLFVANEEAEVVESD